MRDPFFDLMMAGLLATPPVDNKEEKIRVERNTRIDRLKAERDSKKEMHNFLTDILEVIAESSEGQSRSTATIMIKCNKLGNRLNDLRRFADPDKRTTVTEEQRQTVIGFLDKILSEMDAFFEENPKPDNTAFD